MALKENRDVGTMGEAVLKKWSAEVGIVANKANQDKTGWDYLMEFPFELPASLDLHRPLDKANPPIMCLIQVKSSDQRRGRVRVSLKNWARLIFNPIPSFFLCLEFDNKSDPQQAFLVHVGEKYIYHILKRLRMLGNNAQVDLGKYSAYVSYSTNDSLNRLMDLD